MTSMTLDACKTRLLAKLGQAGPDGLTKSGLGIKSNATAGARLWRQALRELEEERQIGNLGNRQRTRYVLRQHYRPLQLACEAIEAKAARPGKPILFTRSELRKGLSGQVAKKADEALDLLDKERKLIPLQRGRLRFYLHARALEKVLLLPSATQVSEPATALPDRERMLAAYHRLVRETEFSDVLIGDLHRSLDVPLEGLKVWLMEECRAGRAVPSLGDWSLSSEAARSAAIHIRGRPHLRIRLLD